MKKHYESARDRRERIIREKQIDNSIMRSFSDWPELADECFGIKRVDEMRRTLDERLRDD